MKRLVLLVPVVVLAACGSASTPQAAPGTQRVAAAPPTTTTTLPAPEAATVISVHDGDTIKAMTPAGTKTIRVVGIDTPEVPPKPAECYGAEAQAFARQILYPGRPVWIQADPAAGDHDHYGRILRVIRFYRGSKPGATYERRLLLAGFANAYIYQHEKMELAAVWIKQAAAARDAKAGGWAACPGASTDPYRAWSTGPAS